MDAELAAWESQVRAAALVEDRDLLRALYAEGRARFGDAAAHEWATALAAFDGTAVTG